MPRAWMDVSNLSFNALLLLEQVELSWLPGWLPETDLKVALRANPVVEWYLRNKCPQLNPWLDVVMASPPVSRSPGDVRQAEINVLASMTDLMVYAVDPAIYDSQPFTNWDPAELISLANFQGKTVIDVGAGTGKLSLIAAMLARHVFAVEPVGNLREYLKQKASSKGLKNVFVVDGLITGIPFPDQFADITMGGHVFGDSPAAELDEMERVTAVGGQVILCPGNNDLNNDRHAFLLSHGFASTRFEEPRDGIKRKYWKTIT